MGRRTKTNSSLKQIYGKLNNKDKLVSEIGGMKMDRAGSIVYHQQQQRVPINQGRWHLELCPLEPYG